MTSAEQPTSQRKLRQTARTKLATLEAVTHVNWSTGEEVFRDALKAVVMASARATPKTKQEFAGRLASKTVVIGDLATDPGSVKLWRPFTGGGENSMRRDGQIIDTSGDYKVLDIVSDRDTCCVTPEQLASADDAWSEGTVLLIDAEEPVNCPALLLPRSNVPPQFIGEALSRHFEAPVSSVEFAAA